VSRSTLANAIAELVALFTNGTIPAISGVDAVYDHLPPAGTLDAGVTVAVFLVGVDANFWHLAVRVHTVQGQDAKGAQDRLASLLPAIDTLTNTGAFGPAAWAFEYPTADPWVYTATCVYEVGRQDI